MSTNTQSSGLIVRFLKRIIVPTLFLVTGLLGGQGFIYGYKYVAWYRTPEQVQKRQYLADLDKLAAVVTPNEENTYWTFALSDGRSVEIKNYRYPSDDARLEIWIGGMGYIANGKTAKLAAIDIGNNRRLAPKECPADTFEQAQQGFRLMIQAIAPAAQRDLDAKLGRIANTILPEQPPQQVAAQ
jgi:hypothetical protein